MFAHDEGVYSVDLNDDYVASGGEEGSVRVWARADGALLRCYTLMTSTVTLTQPISASGISFKCERHVSVALLKHALPPRLHRVERRLLARPPLHLQLRLQRRIPHPQGQAGMENP